MNLIELATGSASSELKVVMAVVIVLSCNALGIDATAVLALCLDGSDAIKYGELVKAAKGADPGNQ